MMGNLPGHGEELLERLAGAVNRHDLDAVQSCFALDYRNETPAHPVRGFTGRAQVRRNWEQIFAFKPALARHARAALAMDTIDMSFDPGPTRQAFPDLPDTDMPSALKELLA